MERVHWIFMPFLLAILCPFTGFVSGFPTPTMVNTEIVTDLVEQGTQSSPAHVFDTQETTQPLQMNASTSPSEVSTSALNNTGVAGIPSAIVPTSPNVTTTTTTTTTTMQPSTTKPALTTRPLHVPTSFLQLSTVKTTHSTTQLVTTVLPTTTTLSTTTAAATTTTPPTPQAPAVVTTATPTAVPVHETTLRVSTTASVSTPHEAPLTSSMSATIPEKQTTKESGDWNIIGITGNSFTGKILLPIAVGTAFSVIIIAVAYCYCSRKGPRRLAKSSRNGVHRMTSNDRVMLLADSSEDEF